MCGTLSVSCSASEVALTRVPEIVDNYSRLMRRLVRRVLLERSVGLDHRHENEVTLCGLCFEFDSVLGVAPLHSLHRGSLRGACRH